jgi:hypothetical protein
MSLLINPQHLKGHTKWSSPSQGICWKSYRHWAENLVGSRGKATTLGRYYQLDCVWYIYETTFPLDLGRNKSPDIGALYDVLCVLQTPILKDRSPIRCVSHNRSLVTHGTVRCHWTTHTFFMAVVASSNQLCFWM